MISAVSVIVPVYNVEKYIEKCARSLFEQALEDVEFIFVNDGTPDSSMSVLRSVLEDYPQRAPFVKIVEKARNEGLPAARRTGLGYATGEYVAHCDSDDWVEPGYLSEMYAMAKEHAADAVACRYFENDREIPSRFDPDGRVRFSDLIAAKEMVSVWRFLFRRELYSKDIIFPEANQGEDQALVVQLAYYSNDILVVDKPLYHWRVNMESITRNPSAEAVSRRFGGACANTELVESFLEREGIGEKYAAPLTALKLYSKFYMRPLLRQGEGIDAFRKAFPEIKGHVLFNKEINFVHKIEYFVAMYCPASIIMILYKWRKSSR